MQIVVLNGRTLSHSEDVYMLKMLMIVYNVIGDKNRGHIGSLHG